MKINLDCLVGFILYSKLPDTSRDIYVDILYADSPVYYSRLMGETKEEGFVEHDVPVGGYFTPKLYLQR
jgi:hypothetical protein